MLKLNADSAEKDLFIRGRPLCMGILYVAGGTPHPTPAYFNEKGSFYCLPQLTSTKKGLFTVFPYPSLLQRKSVFLLSTSTKQRIFNTFSLK